MTETALMPVVVQHAVTGEVLMVAFADVEALEQTRQTGWAHFFSRRRRRLWRKGETSGHGLRVLRLRTDCDQDAWIYEALPTGPVCHTGTDSCFDAVPSGVLATWLWALERVVRDRQGAEPTVSYTARLFQAGLPHVARKVGEEALEVLVAALQEGPDRCVQEVADLVYHLTVLLVAQGRSWQHVFGELRSRHHPASPEAAGGSSEMAARPES
ncbi:MAG: bifunctional phosphoribosyl-AMP cyclohydrolase/phosphoribosyl-ATP diphosphatase HisIE [Acidobacteria bacterium]|nr:bifunctional phosphoribosyl-AMP cyclohydrolase/phosphoribosyl-ATP diphosphatase HisIE [Acidobacteriota bacterium]MDW7983371.1 bifunctional phosphoribosyl-AMP cyclohydrolase/phosphoribosyl-ATP diphosphatase HisIE [Acidobacteriota bacterium]